MKAIVDCNSFYCFFERVFKPELNRRPVVVLSDNNGCIISHNTGAKLLGIEMEGPYCQMRDLIKKN